MARCKRSAYGSIANSLPMSYNVAHRKEIYYDIVTKRGMISGNKPKKQVRFFSEGSTFPNLKNIYGRILYVHEKAVEYGFAFNVGISYG